VLAQARARDLWQSRLLFPHLVVQSFVAGSALLVLGSLYLESGRPLTELLFRCLLGGLCVHGVLVLSEMALPHGTRDATEAVRYLVHGPLARSFWLGAVLGGIIVPIHFLAFYLAVPRFGAAFALAAAVLALVGLLSYQDCHVRAGQALPLS